VKQPEGYDADAFARDTHVSRETMAHLSAYADLLLRWNAKINLIGKTTEADLWWRHMLDSAQLMPLIPENGDITLVDMGSGAGFPGLVLAAMGVRKAHVIEGDQRKAAFLREAVRVLEAPVTVHACRTDAAPKLAADVLTARALAPLETLLTLGEPFTTPSTVHIYPKGQNVEGELTATHKIWKMNVERIPSRTESAATILRLSEVRRVQSAPSRRKS
jgi:16S rRNA (guanine527-N7)-methyltransferase